jgi:hypothetical protein
MAVPFGPGSEFGFRNPLPIFNLPTPTPQTDPLQVRHTFGLGSLALHHQKNPLLFFRLLPEFCTLTAPHNRQVEGSNPSGPTIFYNFHRLITA